MATGFRKGKAAMKDLGALMKQAQAMQQKLTEAQARLAETTADGVAGAGMVKLTLKGSGELTGVTIDDALLTAGEGEILADLLVAAHADAKRKLDAAQAEAMRAIAGPFGGLPGFPGLS
ncbi:MAG TPA: YbaB/EbfC family nucleoid-associated protein [Caulobacteraceae bacterium]|nr:YbaB/EbfC family nucleoid-associated protein [Caulobacteraceae bacterium]